MPVTVSGTGNFFPSVMAEVVPFPLTRRAAFIRRLAVQMASYRPDAAERTLRVRLDGAHAAMLRCGVAPDIAANQVRALEVAARAVLRTLTMRGGDVA